MSILKNGPDSFKGRKLGIYIAEGADADVVKALQQAAKDAGAMAEIIAPHVAGAKLSDRKVMYADEKFDGGPVGVDSLAAAVSEERGTIEDVLEPFLIQQGFILRTPRGRIATRHAYAHFGIAFQGSAAETLSLDLDESP